MKNNDAELSFVQHVIASVLDNPSVYMGGPSMPSLRKARAIIEQLQHLGVSFVVEGHEEVESSLGGTQPPVLPLD